MSLAYPSSMLSSLSSSTSTTAAVLRNNSIRTTVEKQTCLPSHIVSLEDGWAQIETQGMERLREIIAEQEWNAPEEEELLLNEESLHKKLVFSAKEAMGIYSIVFQMSNQPDPYNWSQDLYHYYSRAMEEHTMQHVSPAITAAAVPHINPNTRVTLNQLEQYDTYFLITVLTKCNEYGFFAKWMKSFFHILDTMVAQPQKWPLLRQVALRHFDAHILQPHERAMRQAILGLVQQERNVTTAQAKKRIMTTALHAGDESMSHHSSSSDTDSEDGMRRQEQRLLLVTETCDFLESIYHTLEENQVLLLSNGKPFRSNSQQPFHPRAIQLQHEFVAATREYYAHKRDSSWKYLNAIKYYKLAQDIIDMEQDRANHELHYMTVGVTGPSFVDVVRQELLEKAPMRPPPPPPTPAEITYLKSKKNRKIYSSKTGNKSCMEHIPIIGFVFTKRRERRVRKAQKKAKAMSTGAIFMVQPDAQDDLVVPTPPPRKAAAVTKKPKSNYEGLLCLSPTPKTKATYSNKQPQSASDADSRSKSVVLAEAMAETPKRATKAPSYLTSPLDDPYLDDEDVASAAGSLPSVPSLSHAQLQHLTGNIVTEADADCYSLPPDESLSADNNNTTIASEDQESSLQLLAPQENAEEEMGDHPHVPAMVIADHPVDHDETQETPATEGPVLGERVMSAKEKNKQKQENLQNLLESLTIEFQGSQGSRSKSSSRNSRSSSTNKDHMMDNADLGQDNDHAVARQDASTVSKGSTNPFDHVEEEDGGEYLRLVHDEKKEEDDEDIDHTKLDSLQDKQTGMESLMKRQVSDYNSGNQERNASNNSNPTIMLG
uniref:Cullin N-terminal domain-containing protein n=1 Tax=Entomoneis paludosa TaxID=265537 RepID=A0A7S2YQ14_9STRA|mmetsp:Transcript_5377/g.11402  ORF Transcript_5377/g.11402 Transcript_5377/m.11402 type:complete len:829 (+) Transcript_5377:89-2575(+)